MPTLAQLKERFKGSSVASVYSDVAGETLIYDQRSRITPAQAVERKLGIALRRKTDRLRDSLLLTRRKPK